MQLDVWAGDIGIILAANLKNAISKRNRKLSNFVRKNGMRNFSRKILFGAFIIGINWFVRRGNEHCRSWCIHHRKTLCRSS